MAAFVERLAHRPPLLWLDYEEYAGTLLAGGNVPWLDITAGVAWLRKAQSLLKSDVVAVPAASICAAWIRQNPALQTAMASKRRAVYPLRVMLADPGLRAQLHGTVQALRANFSDLTLALVCPSPPSWVAAAYRQAFGDAVQVEIGEDEIDSAALYIADFLRVFGDCRLDVLLLQESSKAQSARAPNLAAYRAALNVAANYRWDVGLQTGGKCGADAAEFGFLVARDTVANVPCGCVVSDGFWNGEPPPENPLGGFRYARIPPETPPERVLERLALLR
jgi:hypothetical protein